MPELEEMKLMPILQPNKLFITENRDHTLYEYYLLGDIGNPEDYVDLCHALRNSRPEDKFIVRFNSGGGQLRTGNQILNALYECPATTIGYIEHDCGSMCTFLFLACKTWAVSQYAEWFSHTVSGGNFGKECETFEASQFLRRQTHKRIRDEYEGFLTEEEIEKILTGTDIYLDADEIMDRLETYSEVRDAKQVCDCPECQAEQEDDESFDLLSVIEEKVQEGVAKAVGDLLKSYDLVEKPKPVKQPRKKKVTSKEAVTSKEVVDKGVEGE